MDKHVVCKDEIIGILRVMQLVVAYCLVGRAYYCQSET